MTTNTDFMNIPQGSSNPIYRWMVRYYQHEHTSGLELGPTELAEQAAYEFDRLEWLDDPTHWVWDAAAIVAPFS